MRDALVSMSNRLERLWRETRRSTGPAGWDIATDSLVTAMTALEGYAGLLRPDLGRRDWRTRGELVPAQRSTSVSTRTSS